MAAATLQFEKLAVDIAEEALKKAEQEFHQQLGAFQTATKQHQQRASDYKSQRKLAVY
jgi:hypothetical protein